MDQQQVQFYKGAVESLLFVSDKPVTLEQFKQVFEELKPAEIQEILKGLQAELEARDGGMVVVEIAGGYQMLSNAHFASFIRKFYRTYHKEKLSKPSLETLAIVAYKQPVGRAEIEVIRGVNSDGVVAHLLNKGLIEVVGRKEVPGRPFLYGTTKEFLDYFGLKSLEDMPKLEALPRMTEEQQKAIEQAEQQAVEQPEIEAKAQPVQELEEAALSQEPSGQARLANETSEEKTAE